MATGEAEAVEANPDYNVIVITHGYLDSDGGLIDAESSAPLTVHGGINNGATGLVGMMYFFDYIG